MVGGGLDKAEAIARRLAGLNVGGKSLGARETCRERKDFETVELKFRAALAVVLNEVGRALDLGAFLSSRGRYSESETLFRAAEKSYPCSPKVLYICAAAYVQSKRSLDEAESLLNRYLAEPYHARGSLAPGNRRTPEVSP